MLNENSLKYNFFEHTLNAQLMEMYNNSINCFLLLILLLIKVVNEKKNILTMIIFLNLSFEQHQISLII